MAAHTVYIETPTDRGSGFLIIGLGGDNPGTKVITNAHVVESHEKVTVCWAVAQRCADKAVLAVATNMDIAVLEFRMEALLSETLREWLANTPGFTLGWGGFPAFGDVVYASGYPGNATQVNGSIPDPVVTEGVIMRDGARLYGSGERLIEYSSKVSSGSSGGPLMKTNGYVVGIVRGINLNAERINTAVPMSQVMEWLEKEMP